MHHHSTIGTPLPARGRGAGPQLLRVESNPSPVSGDLRSQWASGGFGTDRVPLWKGWSKHFITHHQGQQTPGHHGHHSVREMEREATFSWSSSFFFSSSTLAHSR